MPSFDLAVIGLGYVGLPLARAAASAGLRVAGLDIAAEVVAGLGAGRSHIQGIADREIAAILAAGFAATDDPAVLGDAETVAVCVPTGLGPDGAPDLEPLITAVCTAAERVRRGTLVVLESTSFPGTAEEVARPLFERAGFSIGEDLYLGCSPERIDPGNPDYGIENTPKVVAGCTPLCAKRTRAFYEHFVVQVAEAAGTREAEMAKLLENTYRAVNIALVNSFALYCDQVGIDVWDVLRLAATKPFGFQAFSPGPGVGGHCIPVDPAYLVHRARRDGFDFALVREAERINAAMPGHVARRALTLLAGERRGEPARALVLGVAYKADLDDVRESPAFGVAEALLAAGVEVEFHDPCVDRFTVAGRQLARARDPYSASQKADITVLLQPHRCYDLPVLARRARRLFDTTGRASGPRVSRL